MPQPTPSDRPDDSRNPTAAPSTPGPAAEGRARAACADGQPGADPVGEAMRQDPPIGPTDSTKASAHSAIQPRTGSSAGRLGTFHQRRLRALWRSAGWPSHDAIEAELLAAGLLVAREDAHGHIRLRPTPAGIAAIAQSFEQNRRTRDAHEQLVAQVALQMQRMGRIVWRGLALRAPLPVTAPERRTGDDAAAARATQHRAAAPFPDPSSADAAGPLAGHPAGQHPDPLLGHFPGDLPTHHHAIDLFPSDPADATTADQAAPPRGTRRWVMAMPDVYSIRNTSRAALLHPVAHEIKAHRSDLLADLRRPDKAAAYRMSAAECWYAIREGIAAPDEIPAAYGVLIATAQGRLVVARAAPVRAFEMPFVAWMALARAAPLPPLEDDPPQLADWDEEDDAAAAEAGAPPSGGNDRPAP